MFPYVCSKMHLKQSYFVYKTPILEYAEIIWSGAPQHLLSKLDYITNKAVRIVTGAPARSSISDLYNETGWLSLSKRRELHFLKMMFNVANNLSPSYLSNIVPPIIKELPPQVGRLRQNIKSRTNCGDFPTTRTSLKLLGNLFPAIGTKLWNALPPKIKSLNSIGSFKRELYKFITLTV